MTSLFIPFLIAGIGLMVARISGISSEELAESDILADLVGYLVTGIAVAIACFFICRAHPKSVWYTPILSNGMTLLMGANYFTGNLLLHDLLLTLGVGWLLSIIASIWGSRIGRRHMVE